MPDKASILSFQDKIELAISSETFVSLTASNPFSKTSHKKLSFKPTMVKGSYLISKSYLDNNKQYTQQLTTSDFKENLKQIITAYKQLNAQFSDQSVQLLINKKGEGSSKIKPKARKVNLKHNKEKSYLIPSSTPFLIQLDLSTKDGKVKDKAQKKYRQINKFIELIKPHFEVLPAKANVYDFGCGKGYLTFAMDEYFNQQLKKNIQIHGIDLKEDVIKFVQKLASDRPALAFIHGDISDQQDAKIDALIALHACDTATDIAIAKAIKQEAQLIIVAPCCQKQIRKEMKEFASNHPMLKHGILLERQASLLTDTIRGLILESHGYKTKIFEFISTEHTAKNIMIIGEKSGKKQNNHHTIQVLKAQYGIKEHALEKLLT